MGGGVAVQMEEVRGPSSKHFPSSSTSSTSSLTVYPTLLSARAPTRRNILGVKPLYQNQDSSVAPLGARAQRLRRGGKERNRGKSTDRIRR